MKKYFSALAVLLFLINCLSCVETEKFKVEINEVVFNNFSPQTVTILKAYSKRDNGIFDENDCFHTYTDGINSYDYYIFTLPASIQLNTRFYVQVRMEDGEVYGGDFIYSSDKHRKDLCFSVDYEFFIP